MTYLPLGTNSQNASFRNEDLPPCDKEPGDPGLSWKAGASFRRSRRLRVAPCPTLLAHQLFGLSLMLSLSFLHLLSFSSLLSPVNLVTEKQEVHFLLT